MKKEKGFEGYLNELEEIVDKLESGEADLDASIELYEKGMKLTEKCREILKEKKLKIEILRKKTEEGYVASDFEKAEPEKNEETADDNDEDKDEKEKEDEDKLF
jgi:exodeoxyribonuclease VII small subunit